MSADKTAFLLGFENQAKFRNQMKSAKTGQEIYDLVADRYRVFGADFIVQALENMATCLRLDFPEHSQVTIMGQAATLARGQK